MTSIISIIHIVIIIIPQVMATAAPINTNFFFSLNMFLIIIFHEKGTCLQMNLIFSINILLPFLGASGFIASAGFILIMPLTPQNPEMMQNNKDNSTEMNIL